jgi:hypothetical protein
MSVPSSLLSFLQHHHILCVCVQSITCEVWGSHSSIAENSSLSVRSLPAEWNTTSAQHLNKALKNFYEAFWVSSHVNVVKCTDVSRNTVSPVDGGHSIPRNVGAFYNIDTAAYPKSFIELKPPWKYKVVQIWPGQTVTCLHTNSPGHIWTTLYQHIHLKIWYIPLIYA